MATIAQLKTKLARAKIKKMPKLAKGYFGGRSKLYRYAAEAVASSFQYGYRGRHKKKSYSRGLEVIRINAACRNAGISYSRFIEGLNAAGVKVDRRALASLAVHDEAGFSRQVTLASEALRAKAVSSPGEGIGFFASSYPKELAAAKTARAERKAKTRKKVARTAAARRLEMKLAENLVADAAAVSPDINSLCDTYGLRREELARLTGFSLRALADWSTGKLPSQPAHRRLHEVRRLLDALGEIVPSETIPGWLRRPNPAFENLTPLQIIELGEIDRLWAMVYERSSGMAD